MVSNYILKNIYNSEIFGDSNDVFKVCKSSNDQKEKAHKTFMLNFGPQHPAAHGVLRLVLRLNGERVVRAIPQIGLLHRGTEKLIETKNVHQTAPYLDRLDYVSMMNSEHLFCLLIENLYGEYIPAKASYIRMIYSELTRILNHLMCLCTHALDTGALTPLLWGFEERERIMEFYERISGARVHAAYIRPGGVAKDFPPGLLKDINFFAENFIGFLDNLEDLLTDNRIFQARLVGVGTVDADEAIDKAYTGPMLRATGVNWDLRRDLSYERYCRNSFRFSVPVGTTGDCYDRYLVRLQEMRESSFMVRLFINEIVKLPASSKEEGVRNCFTSSFDVVTHAISRQYMEGTINHFKFNSEHGMMPPIDRQSFQSYTQIEAPKGEFGGYIKPSNQDSNLYRCRIRSPGFVHLQGIEDMCVGHMIADVVAIIGSQDLVFGEVDR